MNNIRRAKFTHSPYLRKVPQACMQLLSPQNPDVVIQDVQAVAEMVLASLIDSVEQELEKEHEDPDVLIALGRVRGALESAERIVEALPFINRLPFVEGPEMDDGTDQAECLTEGNLDFLLPLALARGFLFVLTYGFALQSAIVSW